MQGNIYWNQKRRIKYTYPYLTKDETCDVLIVGGGISGALSAYFQAKMGYRVILVEQNLIGYAGTAESNGIMENGVDLLNSRTNKNVNKSDTEKCNKMCREALNDIEAIVDEINEFSSEAKIGFRRQNLVGFSERITGKFAVNKEYDLLVSEGIRKVEYMEDADILDLTCAIEVDGAAAIIDPYEFTQELVNLLKNKYNVLIYENTKIENINAKGNITEALTSNRFKILTDKIILAAGINTLEFLKDIELDIYRTFTLVAEGIENLDQYNLKYVAKDVITPDKYIRFDRNYIIINGEDIKITDKRYDEEDEKINAGKYKKLFGELSKLTDVDELKITNCYFGNYVMTKDGLPIVDEINNMPNVYCNLPVGKNTVVFSAIGAKILQNICKDYYTKNMYLFRAFR